MVQEKFILFIQTNKIKQAHVKKSNYFLNKGFDFQSFVCSRFHDVIMLSFNLSNIGVLGIKDIDHRFIISEISKH